MLHHSIHIKCHQVYRDRKYSRGCQELGERAMGLLIGMEFLLGVTKMFWNWTVVMVA
jgi:hypothetical protein